MTNPSPSTPSIQQLMAEAGGGAIPTGAGPDIWGTGQYGDMSVALTRNPGFAQGKQISHPHERVAGGGENFLPLYEWFNGVPYETDTTVNAALKDGYNMSPEQLQSLQQKMWLAGLYGSAVKNASQINYGNYDEDTVQAYSSLLQQTAILNARGQDVTVEDVLNNAIKDRTATGAIDANGNPSGTTHTSTNTSSSYDLSDPETAKAILSSVVQAYTGVGIPDAATTAAFQTALNSYERQHPSVGSSTSTSTSDGLGNSSSNSSSTSYNSGLTDAGRQQFAQDYLFSHEGDQVGDYQAATTYYQAALKALPSPVSVANG